MDTAYMTSKGRLVVPARLRRKYGIEPGTKICFIEWNDEILLWPVTRQYIRSVRGILKSRASATQQLLKERTSDKRRGEVRLKKFGGR